MQREGTGWQVKGMRARGVAERQSPSDRVHTNACAPVSASSRDSACARERAPFFLGREDACDRQAPHPSSLAPAPTKVSYLPLPASDYGAQLKPFSLKHSLQTATGAKAALAERFSFFFASAYRHRTASTVAPTAHSHTITLRPSPERKPPLSCALTLVAHLSPHWPPPEMHMRRPSTTAQPPTVRNIPAVHCDGGEK